MISYLLWIMLVKLCNLFFGKKKKTLQSVHMQIDIAIEKLKCLVTFLKNYNRDSGFASALDSATCLVMEISSDTTFCERRVVKGKTHFDENINDSEVVRSAEEFFRIDYFLYIADKVMTPVKVSFEQFAIMRIYLDFYLVLKN